LEDILHPSSVELGMAHAHLLGKRQHHIASAVGQSTLFGQGVDGWVVGFFLGVIGQGGGGGQASA
jgi:hypothetical protein